MCKLNLCFLRATTLPKAARCEACGAGGTYTPMEDLQSSEESAFVQEDVSAIIKEVCQQRAAQTPFPCQAPRCSGGQAIESVLMPCTYQHTKVPQWTNNVRRHAPRTHNPALSRIFSRTGAAPLR